ncbi:hypothetical protein BU15DRAFT_77550 [Melanogaster broomeanus]|nr:hypothetical protein BU15DRAFT_77550 [Melanogaster broomeanus]
MSKATIFAASVSWAVSTNRTTLRVGTGTTDESEIFIPCGVCTENQYAQQFQDRLDVDTITEGLATVNLSGGGGTPSTARATSSSITAPSPSAVVNRMPTNNPATQPTTLPFAQLGRSPSRPGTPGQACCSQTPVNIQVQETLNNELNCLPSGVLTSIKQEMGLHEKDLHSLTLDEKNRIVALSRQRHGNQGVRKPGPSGPQGLAGPSNPVQGMQHPVLADQEWTPSSSLASLGHRNQAWVVNLPFFGVEMGILDPLIAKVFLLAVYRLLSLLLCYCSE